MSRSPTERLLLSGDGAVTDAQGRHWPDFASWCAGHAGARVALLAGPDRLTTLLVPPDLPLADEAALRDYARLQFGHYFGAAARDWPLATWRRGACAIADGGLAALQAAAAAQRVRIVSLRPSWTLAPAEDGDAAVVDGPLLTWLRRRGGELVELQQRHVDATVLQELQGTRLLQAHELLAAAPGGQDGPDFIARPSRGRPLAWAWAASAAAACALIAVQAAGQQAEAGRLAEQAALLDRLAARSASPAKVADAAARARRAAVARQLGTDWPALWTGVERSLPAGLQLAGLDLERQSLRLEGQADDPEAVTRLVDRLAGQAAAGEEVVLTRLQQPDSGAGALRFELVRRSGGPR